MLSAQSLPSPLQQSYSSLIRAISVRGSLINGLPGDSIFRSCIFHSLPFPFWKRSSQCRVRGTNEMPGELGPVLIGRGTGKPHPASTPSHLTCALCSSLPQVAQTADGVDADLWKDGLFKSKVTRYLCFTRSFSKENVSLMVVSPLAEWAGVIDSPGWGSPFRVCFLFIAVLIYLWFQSRGESAASTMFHLLTMLLTTSPSAQ